MAFHDRVPLPTRWQAVNRLNLVPDGASSSPYFACLCLPGGAAGTAADIQRTLDELRRDPAVRVAEPDYFTRPLWTPNDPDFSRLWGLHNTRQTGGEFDADIDAPQAWDLTTGSSSIRVAVIDTGIDYTHPDLEENILRDGSGQLVGYDFLDDDADPMDETGHGTHVAGTIGARGNNSVGIAGVAPRVKLMPLRAIGGSTDGIIRAIDYARVNGARVMNNSWAFVDGSSSQLTLEAIQRANHAGILFVAAAGNEDQDNDEVPTYPANYNSVCPNVISVAATDAWDYITDFSNYGTRSVDLAAPGSGIHSTLPGGAYGESNGTSMAAPHVSGGCALILAHYPGISASDVKKRLLQSVDRPAGLDGYVATGRLNVNQALRAAVGGSGSGLAAIYFDEPDFKGTSVGRVDGTVDHDWGGGEPVSGIGADSFTVRWSGKVEAPGTGRYTFHTLTDDGVRLWVNGQLLIDRWVDQGATEWSGQIDLESGRQYDLRMEYYEAGGGAVARLLWTVPSQSREVIPQDRLYPIGGDGVVGTYYDDAQFRGRSISRIDTVVDHAWGDGIPADGFGADSFTVRWTGKVQAPTSETYTFHTITDDGVRLWVNGQLLIDRWVDQGATEWTGSLPLEAGQFYDLRMEYFENGGEAVARLIWSSSSTGKEVIPKERLYPVPSDTGIAPDAHEADDSPADASYLGKKDGQRHSFHASTDIDYVQFYVPKGARIDLRTYELTDGADTVLTLYDPDGSTVIAENDDHAGGKASRVRARARSAGDYYASIRQYEGQDGTGQEYSLWLKVTRPRRK